MTALSIARASSEQSFAARKFTLASGLKAWVNGIAVLDLTTGTVKPATSASDSFLILGKFAEDVDATAAAQLVKVNLIREVRAEWFAQDATFTAAVAGATSVDVGKIAYLADDQTVTATATGRSIAGRVWAVETRGVLVERADSSVQAVNATTQRIGVATAYVANDSILATVTNGAVYDVPTTGANSTITLPAAAAIGTQITFCADGTKNGHTVQYRDATGPTVLTTALTASKRHMAICTKITATAWVANAYISP